MKKLYVATACMTMLYVSTPIAAFFFVKGNYVFMSIILAFVMLNIFCTIEAAKGSR